MSGSSEHLYLDKSLCEKLENYFWPYTATNKVSGSVCLPSCLFCIFRIFALALNIAALCLYLLKEDGEKYIYFTFWSLLLTVFNFSLILLNYRYSPLWKFTHFLFEANWSLTVSTTLMYWIFLADRASITQTDWRLWVHVVMIACVSFDLLNNQIYFFRRHFGLVLLVGLGYICANVIYSMVKGPVYSELDFTDSDSYLILAVGFTFLVLAFVLGGLIDKLKIGYLSKRPEDQDFLEEYADRNASLLKTIFGHVRGRSHPNN